MKKLMMAALVLGTCAATAATVHMYRFRATGTFTVAKVFTHKDISEPARLGCVSVRYAAPYTGTFYVLARQSGVETVKAQVQVSAGTSVVVAPDDLWLDKADIVAVSNSVSAQAAAVLDYVE